MGYDPFVKSQLIDLGPHVVQGGDVAPHACERNQTLVVHRVESAHVDVTLTSFYGKCSSSKKITAHLDHVRHGETASRTNWSNRWTDLLFIIDARRD